MSGSRWTSGVRHLAGIATVAALLLVQVAAPARGHFATIAYSLIEVGPDEVVYDLYFDPYHVRSLVALDHDEDGYVVADEVTSSREALAGLARDALRVSRGDVDAEVAIGDAALVTAGSLSLPEAWRPTDDFPLVHIPLEFRLPSSDGDVRITYTLLEHPDLEEHENVATAVTPATSYLHVFDPDAPELVIEDDRASAAVGAATAPPAAAAGAGVVGGLVVLAATRRRSRSRRRSLTGASRAGPWPRTRRP